MDKVKSLSAKELQERDLGSVLFLQPDSLVFFFEEEAAKNAGTTAKVRGYNVKVNYQAFTEE